MGDWREVWTCYVQPLHPCTAVSQIYVNASALPCGHASVCCLRLHAAWLRNRYRSHHAPFALATPLVRSCSSLCLSAPNHLRRIVLPRLPSILVGSQIMHSHTPDALQVDEQRACTASCSENMTRHHSCSILATVLTFKHVNLWSIMYKSVAALQLGPQRVQLMSCSDTTRLPWNFHEHQQSTGSVTAHKQHAACWTLDCCTCECHASGLWSSAAVRNCGRCCCSKCSC